jgi:hypothetical protein
MSIEGMQLANTMLAIHAAEMEQADRCPDWRREARIQRQIQISTGGNQVICGLGCLLEKLGRHLQEHSMPSTLPLGQQVPEQR